MDPIDSAHFELADVLKDATPETAKRFWEAALASGLTQDSPLEKVEEVIDLAYRMIRAQVESTPSPAPTPTGDPDSP
jgi:hypothetical protein